VTSREIFTVATDYQAMTFSLHAKYKHLYNFPLHYYNGDQGIVIGVATNYGLGGPGFPTTVGARFSVQTG